MRGVMQNQTDPNQLQINALVADAQAQADAASQLWAEVYASRLQQNLGALKANLTQQLAGDNISSAQQISQAISGAHAQAAAYGGVQVEVIDLPSVSVKPMPKLQSVNIQALLPAGGLSDREEGLAHPDLAEEPNQQLSLSTEPVDPEDEDAAASVLAGTSRTSITPKEREVLVALDKGETCLTAANRIFAGKKDPTGAWHSTVGRLRSKNLI